MRQKGLVKLLVNLKFFLKTSIRSKRDPITLHKAINKNQMYKIIVKF
jgi:hypothetical protein